MRKDFDQCIEERDNLAKRYKRYRKENQIYLDKIDEKNKENKNYGSII